jgi:3-hydroxyacyl-CoA dehydrogenase
MLRYAPCAFSSEPHDAYAASSSEPHNAHSLHARKIFLSVSSATYVASQVKKGAMSQAQADAAMALVRGTLDYSLFKEADMVIEAVIEDVKLKQKIFAGTPHSMLTS